MFGISDKQIKNFNPKWTGKNTPNLYPHQINTVNAIEAIEKIHKYYILADMTGFGKTITIMATISRTTDRNIESNRFLINPIQNEKIRLCDIYITPLHLFQQVCNEAKKCNINYTPVKSYVQCAFDYKVVSQTCDLFIITCTMISTFLENHKIEPFNRIIIDEADTISFNAKYITLAYLQYRNLCLISATLSNEISNYSCSSYETTEGKSLYFTDNRFIPSEKCKFLEIKNDDQDIIDYFKSDFVVNEYVYLFKKAKIIQVISKYLPDSVEYHLATNDIASAIQKMSSYSNNSLNIATVAFDYIKMSIEHTTDPVEIEQLKRRLESLRLDLEKLKEEPCMICYSEIKNCTVTPCCQHLLCTECILTWLANQNNTNNCPMCRSAIKVSSLKTINLSTESIDDEMREEVKEKIEELNIVKTDCLVDKIESFRCIETMERKIGDILEKCNSNSKILIYNSKSGSYHTCTYFDNINSTAELTFEELTGGVREITKIIDNFHKNKTNGLFMNAYSKATGLNFQTTTDIIIMGEFGKKTIIQIRGRALRIGRKRGLPLNIHILKYE